MPGDGIGGREEDYANPEAVGGFGKEPKNTLDLKLSNITDEKLQAFKKVWEETVDSVEATDTHVPADHDEGNELLETIIDLLKDILWELRRG